RRLHVPQLPVLGPVELVHHVSIPSEPKVLRRSLEPAHHKNHSGGGDGFLVDVEEDIIAAVIQ
ncbi:hypothetical protein, partial [Pseudoscardovia suis]|uniref:hypothetical protein n=1 Tax=Pseudoscardovia suis TaxID=987063 RepID=UPI003F99340D